MRIFGLEITRPKRAPTRFLGDIAKVSLSPGDVCVLMSRRNLSSEEAGNLRDIWRASVGDDVTLILLDDGMKFGVLSPPQVAAVNERLTDEATVDEVIEV